MDAKLKPEFAVVGMDEWSRRLFKSVNTARLYVEVDCRLFVMTAEGEPLSPMCMVDEVAIVAEGGTK